MSCFIQHFAEMAKAMMESEPEVEPNCIAKRAGSVPIRICVWYTPTSEATVVRNRNTASAHLVVIHIVEHEPLLFLRRDIEGMGKVDLIVA